MASIKAEFEHLFLKAADLRNKDVGLTIEFGRFEAVKTRQGTERAFCLYFKKVEEKTERIPNALTGKIESYNMPRMRLWTNPTNRDTISQLHGDDYEQWPGKRVTLYAARVKGLGNTMVDAIRVREVAPPETKKKSTGEEVVEDDKK